MAANTTRSPVPSSQLTSTDIHLVQRTWAAINLKIVEFGAILMEILFRDHPEYRSLFSYGNIPETDWLQNPIFQNSIRTSFEIFTDMVNAIEDPVMLEPMLLKTIKSHKRRHVTKEHFIDLKEATKETFLNFLDEDEVEVWKKALDALFGKIVEEYGEDQ